MATDLLGNPVTCGAEARALVDDFVDGFLRYQPRAVNVLSIAGPDAECLPNVLAGYLWMFLERPEAAAKATPFLHAAEARAAAANDRERAHLAVLRAWVAGDLPLASARAEAITRDWPRDLAALKIAQYHHLNMGDSPAILRAALALAPANPGNPQLLAMTAFGHEQCHHLDAARARAEAALERQPDEPWAHHALAHVLLTQGRTAEGLALMADAAPAWDGLNSFMYTHNWWHLALFHISAGDLDAAMAVHDRHCWGVEPDYSQDQIGAVSLLARLEFAGADPGGRWAALRPWLESRAQDTGNAFLTLHYLYGLGKAGSSVADALMEAVRRRAADAAPWEVETWAETALPAAEGVMAAARGDWGTAVRRLSTAQSTLWKTGGSHAQRDLFDQILLDAMIRDERWTAAQQMLEARRRFDPHGVPLAAMLARVETALGLPRSGMPETTRPA